MKKKIILPGILILILLLGGIGFYILSLPPKETLSKEFKEEAVTKLLGRKANLNPEAIPAGNTQYNGKYISFQYPAKALIYTYNKDTKRNIEDLSFDIKSPKLIFNMTVTDHSGTFNDVPAASLREQRLYEYKKSEPVVDNTKGIVYFKSGQSPEKTGFFIANGKLFTFSVTGTVDVEVGKLFDEVVATVSFVSTQ